MVNWRCLMQGHRWWPIGVTNRHVVYRCRVCTGAKKALREYSVTDSSIKLTTLAFPSHKKASNRRWSK